MSRRREAANRENAAKSTGPRTAAGKARSSLNAITHGLTATNAVIPGESASDLEALESELASHVVDNAIVRSLCTQYAATIWRLARVRRIEAATMSCSLFARFAFQQPLDDREVHDAQDTLVDPTDLLEQMQNTLGQRLQRDMNQLVEVLDGLTRYESMLFAQLLKVSQLLAPFAVTDAEAAPGISEGEDCPTSVQPLIEATPGATNEGAGAKQSQH